MKNKGKSPMEEKKIIEKFQKQERNISIMTGVVIFLSPLIWGVLYFARYYELISDRFIQLVIMMVLIPIVFIMLSRRCPNCGAFMDRYKLFPKTCHKCDVKLK